MIGRRLFTKKYAIVFGALVLSAVLILCGVGLSRRVTDRDGVARWVRENDRAWQQLLAVHALRDLVYDPDTAPSGPAAGLPGLGELLGISYLPDADAACFSFRHLRAPSEGHAYLIWAADPEQAKRTWFFDVQWTQEWADAAQTLHVFRWEGEIPDKSYIQLTEIAPGWYYDEAYLPT